MGKSHTYRQWAVTITGPDAKLPPTPRDGKEFAFADKTWVVVVGPPEGGTDVEHLNQHLGIKCCNYAVSKSAARRALLHALEVEDHVLEDCYFKQVEMSWVRWVDYCFKQKLGNVGSALKAAQDKLVKEGRLPTKRAIQEVLAMEHNFEYYCKRLKPALNEYVTLACMTDDRGTRRDKLDPADNKKAFEESFRILQGQFYQAVKHGRCNTTWEHPVWQLMGTDEKTRFCELLSLLPICTKRSVNVPDKLPGLYMWGPPNTGKSAFFDNGVFLRKFPQDSQGVSRFRLELMNSGLLFDDVPDGFMDRPDISGTVRQMVLGGNSNIKTHGATETVVGYVVVTSNNEPHHLMKSKPADVEASEEQWERNQAAWRRRFITLEFRDNIDTDPISVMWTDPLLREYAASLVIQICRLFKDTCPILYDKYLEDLEAVLVADYCNGEDSDVCTQSAYSQAATPPWAPPLACGFKAIMPDCVVKRPPTPNPFAKKETPAPPPTKRCEHGCAFYCTKCGIL